MAIVTNLYPIMLLSAIVCHLIIIMMIIIILIKYGILGNLSNNILYDDDDTCS
jgi:hypothetical protein